MESGGASGISINQALGPDEFRKLNFISHSGKTGIDLHVKDAEKFCS